jgi:hypothetical protein
MCHELRRIDKSFRGKKDSKLPYRVGNESGGLSMDFVLVIEGNETD